MNKRLALTASIMIFGLARSAHAEVTFGVSLGRTNQGESLVDSKGLTLGVALTAKLRVETSLESLDVDRDSAVLYADCGVFVGGCGSYRQAQGRGLGAAAQYDLASAETFQPYVLGGVTSEHYILPGGAQERYIRSEVGLGLHIKLSSQLQLVGDVRIGKRSIVADDTGDDIGDGLNYAPPVLFPDNGTSTALHVGAQIRF
jgi:hypothetical protein